MEKIIEKYIVLVKKYKEFENESTEQEIHNRRVTLRRIFSILDVLKIKSSKIKNGDKTFELFGKLRDIQVQILKLDSIELTPELSEYLTFIKEKEIKLKTKVANFSSKKKLKFPTIKKKLNVDSSKISKKANKLLNKLIENTQFDTIDDIAEIHKIRISFKKYRYTIEALALVEDIDENLLYKLKIHQDKLGEIQDFEVLIEGITRFFKKQKLPNEINLEIFEDLQNMMIEDFENEVQYFIEDCKAAIKNHDDGKIEVKKILMHKKGILKTTHSEINTIDISNKEPANITETEEESESIKADILPTGKENLSNDISANTVEEIFEKSIPVAKKTSRRKKKVNTIPNIESDTKTE